MLKSIINIYKGKDNPENDNDNLLNHFISNSKKIETLSSFFKDIYNNINTFKESLTDKITSLKNNINDNSKLDDIIEYFYDSSLLYLYKISEILEKYNEIILTPLAEFKTDYDNKSLLYINNLSSLKNNFNEEKNKILFYQKKYYNDLGEYAKYYKNINLNQKSEKDGKKDEELLCKIKIDLDVDRQSYKYQLDYFNDYYQNEFLVKYKKNYKELENIEKGKNYFLKNIFYLYTNNLNNFKKSIDGYISSINSIFKNIKLEENQIFSLNYDNLANFEDEIKAFNKEYKKINSKITGIEINKQRTSSIFNDTSILLVNKLINNFFNEDKKNEDEYNEILNKYFEYLDTNEDIPLKTICEINYLIFNPNTNDFYLLFIDEYIKRHNQLIYVEMKNLFNLNHLAYVLQSKITSFLNSNNILLILLLGQQVYYSDNEEDYINEKFFLCNLLNKMPIFKLNNFWENINHLIIKFIFQKVNNIKNTAIDDSIIKIINNILFDDLNILNESSANSAKYKYKKVTKLVDNIDQFITSIINYDQSLTKKDNQKINDIFTKIHKLILIFISFLNNYNYDINKSKELIIQICDKFSFSKKISKYYITYLKNYSYSIKNSTKLFYYSKNNTENKNESIILSLDKNKIIINNIIKYIDSKNLIKFLLLNKEYNKEMKTQIYKVLLRELDDTRKKDLNKDIDIKIYINIWKNLLNYKEIKKLYPYEENKEKALKILYNKRYNSDFSVIDVDCIRTTFINDDNIEEKRAMLNNVLKTLMLLNKDSNYCQGMNFIVGFILSLCDNNEEETFYLSLSFFKNTSYKNIFLNDLKLLRLNFAIFDKLLYIYIPTIYSYFNLRKIYSNFYISPWFITLFTHLVDEKVKVEHFIEIFNLFIIHGWKAIFVISLNIFYYYEKYILNVKEENLLQFLSAQLSNKFINDINNIELYKNNEIKISKKLIEEIGKEFSQYLFLVDESE